MLSPCINPFLVLAVLCRELENLVFKSAYDSQQKPGVFAQSRGIHKSIEHFSNLHQDKETEVLWSSGLCLAFHCLALFYLHKHDSDNIVFFQLKIFLLSWNPSKK